MSMIKNRLDKNYRKLKPWADRNQIQAFRIYDRDIPEFPFIVDKYGDIFVVYDRSDKWIDKDKNHLPLVLEALKEIFNAEADDVVIKKRERQEGVHQYEKIAETKRRFQVKETHCSFWVNPYDYLDTGLFLDHRPLRYKISKIASGKSFLNLFCYTGSFSVVAAKAGAETTSVDMSRTYLDWTIDNFNLNEIPLASHRFLQSDVIDYLNQPVTDRFDLIYLDPPTFSNSKRMDGTFEVERDQLPLIQQTMKRLQPEGQLFFSTNKRNFKLAPEILTDYKVEDITPLTIPNDFHDQKIHQVYILRNLIL